MLKFEAQVDSIALRDSCLVAGLSNLEGNIWDGCVKTIDITRGEETCSKPMPCGVTCVRVFETSDHCVVAGDDGCIRLLSLDGLQDAQSFTRHDDCVSSLATDNQSRYRFYSCGWDGIVAVWDLHSVSGAPVSILTDAHAGHVNDISCRENEVVSVGDDGYVRAWDLRLSGTVVSEIPIGVSVSSVCRKDATLFVGTDTGEVHALDTRKVTAQFKPIASSAIHNGRVRKLVMVPHLPSFMLSCADDFTVSTNRIGETLQIDCVERSSLHNDFVTDILCEPIDSDRGIHIISASSDMTICRHVVTI